MAEICHYFFPKIVDLHNYRHARRRGGEGPAPRLSRALTPRLPSLLSPASSATGRHYNWTTLQARVLAKLGVPATAGDVISADFTALQWFDLPAVCVSDDVTA